MMAQACACAARAGDRYGELGRNGERARLPSRARLTRPAGRNSPTASAAPTGSSDPIKPSRRSTASGRAEPAARSDTPRSARCLETGSNHGALPRARRACRAAGRSGAERVARALGLGGAPGASATRRLRLQASTLRSSTSAPKGCSAAMRATASPGSGARSGRRHRATGTTCADVAIYERCRRWEGEAGARRRAAWRARVDIPGGSKCSWLPATFEAREIAPPFYELGRDAGRRRARRGGAPAREPAELPPNCAGTRGLSDRAPARQKVFQSLLAPRAPDYFDAGRTRPRRARLDIGSPRERKFILKALSGGRAPLSGGSRRGRRVGAETRRAGGALGRLSAGGRRLARKSTTGA